MARVADIQESLSPPFAHSDIGGLLAPDGGLLAPDGGLLAPDGGLLAPDLGVGGWLGDATSIFNPEMIGFGTDGFDILSGLDVEGYSEWGDHHDTGMEERFPSTHLMSLPSCSLGTQCHNQAASIVTAFTCYDKHTICIFCLEEAIDAYNESLEEWQLTTVLEQNNRVPPIVCPAPTCKQQLSPHFLNSIFAQEQIHRIACKNNLYEKVAKMSTLRESFRDGTK
jgi:hypothetical protein